MKRKIKFYAISVVLFVTAIILASCVDISDTGPVPPDYVAQVRIIYADPALATATISYANNTGDGRTFGAFSDLAAGSFGSVSDYATYKAGSKKIYVKRADGTPADIDTATVTFGTETVSSLVILPRGTVAEQRFLSLGERSTFATVGIRDTARVRIANLLASKDTIDVWQIRGAGASATLRTDNLRYGISTAFSLVPKDSTWRFFISRSTSTSGLGDTIAVTGASNKQYSIVVFDSLSHVRIMKVEDR